MNTKTLSKKTYPFFFLATIILILILAKICEARNAPKIETIWDNQIKKYKIRMTFDVPATKESDPINHSSNLPPLATATLDVPKFSGLFLAAVSDDKTRVLIRDQHAPRAEVSSLELNLQGTVKNICTIDRNIPPHFESDKITTDKSISGASESNSQVILIPATQIDTKSLRTAPVFKSHVDTTKVSIAFTPISMSAASMQDNVISSTPALKEMNLAFDLIAKKTYLKDSAGNEISSPSSGQAVYFYGDWDCIGSGTTPSFRREFRLDGSLYSYLDATAVAGYSYTTHASVAWTATAGSHTLEFILDSNNTIAETSETNNTSVKQCTTAGVSLDLVAERVYLKDSNGNEIGVPAVGQSVYFYADWRCDGSGTTPVFRAEFRLDGSLWSYGEGTATGGYGYTSNSNIPWTATAGTHTLERILDVNNTVTENSEINNVASKTWNSTGWDLVADRVYLKDSAGIEVGTPALGQTIYFYSDWHCDGSGTSASFRAEFKLDGSLYAYWTGTADGGHHYISNANSPWTATSGSHTLEWILDTNANISESNENNNLATKSSTTTGWDLVADRVYLLDGAGNEVTTPSVGESIYFYSDWHCNGSGTTSSFRSEFRLDASLYAFIDGTAIGGHSYSTYTGPWTASYGSHTLEWVVDSNDAVLEADENNNNSSMTWNTAGITVISPNGGEVWPVGATETLTWSSGGTSGSVKIEYSTNGGANWSTIISSTIDYGSYIWTIPNTPSSACLVRISDVDGNPSDQSDHPFTIMNAAITLTKPNAGEKWTAGSSQEITWTSSGTSGNVKIEYSANGGSNWSTIITSTPDDGAYSWTIPNTPSTNCLVKIADTDGTPSDQSDNPFAIQSAYITVNQPNGGEIWTAGTTQSITWNSFGTSGTVKIEYSANNGSSWSTIISSAPDNGIFSWSIPDISSTTCLLRISDIDGNPSDQSDAPFTIQKAYLTVVRPNGGELFTVGTTEQITWTSAATSGNVKIEYSANNGNSWASVISSGPDDGAHPWTIPSTPSTNCLVKISDVDGNPSDQSDAIFTICNNYIVVISPNGNEVWEVGSIRDIVWTSNGNSGNVAIEYSTNGGIDWTVVSSSTPDDGSYSWVIPNTSSTNCLLKIADIDGYPVDQSDGFFTIQSSHFKFTANTGESYSIVIDAATIDNQSLLPGDEIGVFTSAGLCVGATTWTGTTPLSLTAWADDSQTPAIDGYQTGEMMFFRIWSLSSITEYRTVATYSVGNGKFGDGAYARVSRLEALITEQLTVSISDTTGAISSIIDIPIMITDVSGKGIISVAMTIQTDTTVLIPISASNAGTLTAGWGMPTYNTLNGQITVGISGTAPLSGKGKLCFIRCQVNPRIAAGNSTIVHFVKVMLNEGNPPAITRDGLFRVSSGFRVAGNITYYSSNSAIRDAVVSLTGFARLEKTTNMAGQYEFLNVVAGNYTARPGKARAQGDAITPYDAALTLQYIVGQRLFTPYQMIAADVSGNGQVSSYDASLILKYYVQLIRQFPVMSDSIHFWTFVPNNYPISSVNWSLAPDSLRYEPLNTDQLDQNYLAIVYGDPSGNWSPSGMLAGASKTGEVQVTLGLGKLHSLPDNRLMVPIMVSGANALVSAGLMVNYDPAAVKIVAVTTTELTSDFIIAHHVDANRLTIGLAGAAAINQDGAIATIIFESSLSSNEMTDILTLSQADVNEQPVAVKVQPTAQIPTTSIPQQFVLFQNHPNPFNPSTLIRYHLPVLATVKLEIYNSRGELVRTLVNETQRAGDYSASWDGRNESGHPVANGMYIYYLRSGDVVLARKMVLLR